jgi:hypothetical protein
MYEMICESHLYDMIADVEDNQENKESRRRKNGHYYGRVYPGVWLIIIGGFFLLNNFGYFNGDTWGKLWPIFIIVPGILMLWRP